MTSNWEEKQMPGRVEDTALITIKCGLFHHNNTKIFSCDARMTLIKFIQTWIKHHFYKIKNENMEEMVVAYLTIYSIYCMQ